MRNLPFLLIINDGWGIAPESLGNAISQAHTPVFNHFLKNYFVVSLLSSGEAVGLPWGEVGNSEVGHLTIGAGKVLYQYLPRITKAISEGTFFENPSFIAAMNKVKKDNGTLHIAGLLSDGGVHSHSEHLAALLELASLLEVQKVVIHCFLDGRDVPYNTAITFVEDLEDKIKQLKVGAMIGSIAGRYWAMDRDNRSERIQKAYEAIVYGESEKKFSNAKEAIKFYYKQGIYDEQIPPTVITPGAPVENMDSIILFNFRADRMRQLTAAFSLPEFNKFERKAFLENLTIVTMTEYDKTLPVTIAFPEEEVTYPLSRVIAEAGLKQLHIAETEKYAHVTYFFNGGKETAFPGEDRILIPSPHVVDYSEVPEMSAQEIVSRLDHEIKSGKYQFFVVNFANADMVGHTGNLRATTKAIEVLDSCMRQLTESILALCGTVLITADHGNSEVMFDSQTGEIDKEHTSNPVPCILVGKDFVQQKSSVPNLSLLTPAGILADVAPTILKHIGIQAPHEMTGRAIV